MVCLDQSSTETYSSTSITLGLDILMASCILILNTFIIFAVLRYWKRQSLPNTCSNSSFLIINLCTADITLAVFFVYQFLPRYLCSMAEYLSHHYVPCLLRSVLLSTGHYASGFTLVAIAVDRYVAVVHVLHYGEMMNTRRTLTMIGITWLLAIFFSTMPLYWNNWTDGQGCEVYLFQPKYYELVILPMGLCFVIGSMSTIYWRIHRVALTVHNRRTDQDLSALQRINTRSARTLLMILIVYAISWPPYMIAIYIKHTGYHVPMTVFQVISSVNKVNYLANPFIYAFNTRPVRYSALRTLRSFKHKLSPKISIASLHCNSSVKTEWIWTVSRASSVNAGSQNGLNQFCS